MSSSVTISRDDLVIEVRFDGNLFQDRRYLAPTEADACFLFSTLQDVARAVEKDRRRGERSLPIPEVLDEVRSVLTDMRKLVEMPPPHFVEYAPDANNEEAREAARRFVEEFRQGPTIVLPAKMTVERPGNELQALLDGLLTYLGIVPLERTFIQALAQNRLDDDTAAVFADWLEENGRTEAGERVRLLRPQPGNVIVLSVPHERRLLASRFAEALAKSLNQSLQGREEITVIVFAEGESLKTVSLKVMREAGWVREGDMRQAVALERETCAELIEAAAKHFPENALVQAVLYATAEDVRERGESL